jgi:hypothetical protein
MVDYDAVNRAKTGAGVSQSSDRQTKTWLGVGPQVRPQPPLGGRNLKAKAQGLASASGCRINGRDGTGSDARQQTWP